MVQAYNVASQTDERSRYLIMEGSQETFGPRWWLAVEEFLPRLEWPERPPD
jgi:hypothetical protein